MKKSADDILKYFLFLQEQQVLYFMQIVSEGNNLHEMSDPIFLEKKIREKKYRQNGHLLNWARTEDNLHEFLFIWNLTA